MEFYVTFKEEQKFSKKELKKLSKNFEKMLDISIPVPRDFERRTAEEYEAYKQSFQYQLKNKIIPGSGRTCGGRNRPGCSRRFSRCGGPFR